MAKLVLRQISGLENDSNPEVPTVNAGSVTNRLSAPNH